MDGRDEARAKNTYPDPLDLSFFLLKKPQKCGFLLASRLAIGSMSFIRILCPISLINREVEPEEAGISEIIT